MEITDSSRGGANASDRAERTNADRSLVVSYILAITIGFLGAHHFYLRRYGWAALYFFTGGLGGCGLLVDIVRMPWLVNAVNQQRASSPNVADAYTLWLSPLGMLGAHRYYLGHFWWGVLYTLTGGLCMLGWLFDATMLPQLVANEKRSREKKLVRGDRPENVHHSNWLLVVEASFKCFTTVITECSVCVMIVCTTLMVGAMVAWLGGALTVDEAAADSPGQILAIGDPVVKRFFASKELILHDRGDSPIAVPMQSDLFSALIVIFAGDNNKNLLTAESVRRMATIEAAIEGNASIAGNLKTPVGMKYTSLCQLQYTDNAPNGCRPPISLVHDLVFEGRRPTLHEINTLSDELVASRVRAALVANNSIVFQLFDKEFLNAYKRQSPGAVGTMALHSTYVRSQVFFGAPFDDGKPLKAKDSPYRNVWDRSHDQQTRFTQEWGGKFVDWFQDVDKTVKDMGVFYLDNFITSVEIGRLVQGDFLLVAAAGIAVAVVMGIQLQSVFLTFCGMFHVLMSYPIAICIYHEVLQIRINPQFNLLALFLILGIGADDIFVYADCWKQSEHELGVSLPRRGRGALAERVFWVWRKASGAMAVTSCTTFAAFLCTAISPIPNISTFGIMAALLTLFNFLLVITWFPACVVFYHKYVRNEVGPCRTICCRCLYRRSLLAHVDEDDEQEGRTWTGSMEVFAESSEATKSAGPPPALRRRSSIARSSAEVDLSNYRAIERFFYKVLAPAIYCARFFLLAGFGIVLGVMAIGAARLAPPAQEKIGLPEASQLYKALQVMNERFPASESFGFEVIAIWGVEGADAITRGSVDRNNEKRFGRVNMDDSFKLNAATFQSIHSACLVMQSAKRDGEPMAAPNGVKCVLVPFKAYLYGSGGPLNGLTFPEGLFDDDLVMGQHLSDFMKTTDSFGQPWATTFENFVGGIRNRAAARPTYVMVPISSTIPTSHSIETADAWTNRWRSVEDEIGRSAPPLAGKPYITSSMFAVRETQKVLVRETYTSIVISFAVAVAFLLLSTRNWKITGLASLTIACIVICILGIIEFSGDGLGFVQSICATVLVGLSVDYVVHYGVAYHEASMSDRFQRARASMLELGVSIVGGTATSLISNAFLLGTQLLFFQVFGKFIVFTIFLAFIWATFFFMPALMVFGPKHQGDGDLKFGRPALAPQPDPRANEST